MRIVLIHQYYLYEGQGGSARFNDMVAYWRGQGWRVQVIAGQVDYATGKKPTFWQGKLWSKSREGGVEIWRVYTPDTYQRSVWGRGVAWGGFGVAAAACLAALIKGADLCLVTSPPLTVALCAAVAHHKKVPLIVEVRDVWPASAVAVGALRPDGVVHGVLEGMERWMLWWADRVVALTPGIAKDVVERGLASGEKVAVIPNGADSAVLLQGVVDASTRRAWRGVQGWGEETFVVMYMGAHGRANGLEQMIEVARRVRQIGLDVKLVMVGDGPARQGLVEETEAAGLCGVLEWVGGVPKEEVHRWMSAADCGVAILRPHEVFRTVYPNKMFDAMAAARPVLCAIEGVAAEFVREHGVGVAVRAGDAQAVAEGIAWMVRHRREAAEMGRRGREVVEREYNREVFAARYMEVIEEVVRGG